MKNSVLSCCIFLAVISAANAQTYSGKLGYGFSPPGFQLDFSQTGSFLQEVAGFCGGGVVYANTDWRNDSASGGIIPQLQKVVAQLQPSPFAYTDMLTFAWADYPAIHLASPSNPVNNWTNAQTRADFMTMLVHTADSLQPAYMFIGNEVSFYIEQDSLDYLNFISFYESTYDSIKLHSPNTKVGTIFNYEHINGYGNLNGWTDKHWSALTLIDSTKLDVIGFSLYPFLSVPTANAMPADYLDTMFARTGNKPVVITETGWPADSLYGTWVSSPQQQVDYVNQLFPKLAGQNVEDVNWLYLNYLIDTTSNVGPLIFKSVSLRDSLGNDRPALPLWESMCPLTGISPAQNEKTLAFFPNPSDGNFTVQDPQAANAQLRIDDAEGREVYSGILAAGTNRVSLSLPDGFYIATVFTEGEYPVTQKIVIRH
ncbi:MAG TPA: T9SS type A sorting domain-containing protein [Bacteroidia bacterium]|nr:T9SS type A sorting domain-containing protein [Bacteroidia bacterium]